MFDGCGHCVNGVYGADDYRPFEGTSVVTNAYRFEVRHDGEVLPYFFIQASFSKFFTEDCVSFANCFQTIAGNCTKATNAKARTRERLTIYHMVGQAKFYAASANFVFEQLTQGFNQFKLQVFRETANIVVRFNNFSSFGTAFCDVRINGTLTEEVNAFNFASFFFEYADEFFADDFTFLFGVSNAFQFGEEAFSCINVNEVCIQLVFEYFYYAFRFSFAHQAMVYVYANQVVANSFQKESCYYGAIYATGESKQYFFIANLFFNQFDLVMNEVSHIPVSFSFAGFKNKIFQSSFNAFYIVSKLGKFNFAQCFIVTCSNHRNTSFINFREYVNSNAVNDIVRTTVDYDAFYVGQCFQFFYSNVVRINFAINAQCANSSCNNSIFMATKV